MEALSFCISLIGLHTAYHLVNVDFRRDSIPSVASWPSQAEHDFTAQEALNNSERFSPQ
jgi:hypothetical protein